MISSTTIKRQMKDAAGDLNVSTSAVDEAVFIMDRTILFMAKSALQRLKKKKTVSRDILKSIMVPSVDDAEDIIPRSQVVKIFKDYLDQHGTEEDYRTTRDGDYWLAQFINDYIYTLSRLAKKEAMYDNKKTILSTHVKLAHRDLLLDMLEHS